MRRLGGLIAIGAAAMVASCGGSSSDEEPDEGEFDPVVAEEYVRDKARADVRSNPLVVLENPQDPDVTCSEDSSPPDDIPSDAGSFTCEVQVLGGDDQTIARQTWQVVVSRATGPDASVSSASRESSTVDRAPLP